MVNVFQAWNKDDPMPRFKSSGGTVAENLALQASESLSISDPF